VGASARRSSRSTIPLTRERFLLLRHCISPRLYKLPDLLPSVEGLRARNRDRLRPRRLWCNLHPVSRFRALRRRAALRFRLPGGIRRAFQPDHAEIFVDAGVVANRLLADITTITPRVESATSYGAHVALGARRAVSEHQDLGVGVEADDIHGLSLVSARILDYRYRFTGPLALHLIGGAARYATATPAYGFYFGTGLQWRNIVPHWDLGIDYRYAAKVDRLRFLPTDPQGGYRPDAYYDVSMGTLYVSRKF